MVGGARDCIYARTGKLAGGMNFSGPGNRAIRRLRRLGFSQRPQRTKRAGVNHPSPPERFLDRVINPGLTRNLQRGSSPTVMEGSETPRPGLIIECEALHNCRATAKGQTGKSVLLLSSLAQESALEDRLAAERDVEAVDDQSQTGTQSEYCRAGIPHGKVRGHWKGHKELREKLRGNHGQ